MAVIATPNASSLKIKFDCGTDENGDNIMKTRTFNSLKSAATNDDIMTVAKSIIGLQKNTLEGITKVDNTSLSE
ncbi:MAG: DUF1659 domain-containing protein [Terrisporobacter sp.]